jgi:hypothetical protein
MLVLLDLTPVARVAIMVLFAEERLGLRPEGYGALLGALLAARFWLGAITGLALLPIVWPLFTESEIAAARGTAGDPLPQEPSSPALLPSQWEKGVRA